MKGPAFNDVVCAVLVRAQRVLLVHRNASRLWAPDSWDAPGGHIEPGEADYDALARELYEELGIVIGTRDAKLVGRLTGSDYDARVFRVERWSGEPENRAPDEHDEIAWFAEGQIEHLRLADPDLATFARSRPCTTARARGPGALARAPGSYHEQEHDHASLRHTHWPHEDFEKEHTGEAHVHDHSVPAKRESRSGGSTASQNVTNGGAAG